MNSLIQWWFSKPSPDRPRLVIPNNDDSVNDDSVISLEVVITKEGERHIHGEGSASARAWLANEEEQRQELVKLPDPPQTMPDPPQTMPETSPTQKKKARKREPEATKIYKRRRSDRLCAQKK